MVGFKSVVYADQISTFRNREYGCQYPTYQKFSFHDQAKECFGRRRLQTFFAMHQRKLSVSKSTVCVFELVWKLSFVALLESQKRLVPQAAPQAVGLSWKTPLWSWPHHTCNEDRCLHCWHCGVREMSLLSSSQGLAMQRAAEPDPAQELYGELLQIPPPWPPAGLPPPASPPSWKTSEEVRPGPI